MIDLYQATTDVSQQGSQLAPAIPIDESAQRLGWRYLIRQFGYALPKIAADGLAFLSVIGVTWIVGLLPFVSLPLGPVGLSIYLTVCGYASLLISGQYDNAGIHPAVEFRRLLVPVSLLSLCLLVGQATSSLTISHVIGCVTFWLALSISLPVFRNSFRKLVARVAPRFLTPVVILGGGPMGEAIYRSLQSNPGCGFRPLGIVDDPHDQWLSESQHGDWYLGTFEDLKSLVENEKIDWAIVTDANALEDSMDSDRREGIINFSIPNRLYLAETVALVPTIWDQVLTINMVTYIRQTDRLMLPGPRWAKRLSDLFLCSLLALIVVPLSLLIGLAVKLTTSGPMLYRSRRIGRGNRLFEMSKFRSMHADADTILEQKLNDCPATRDEWELNKKLKKDPRITAVGQVLRRTSLDELPQLFDVFRGKMSLVGPRPMLVSEPDLYGRHYGLYCRMRPGITGLWQVSGRNNTSHEQRVRLVAYYVQNWSPWLDIYILAKTFKVVFTGEGAW